MTPEDFEHLRQVCPPDAGRVGVFSPLRMWEHHIFARYTALSRWRWNLNSGSRNRYDLLVAANVFMYSPDPALWFRNVLSSCKYFILQDVVRRRRAPDSEFGTDGDCMRYGVGTEIPRIPDYFPLERLGNRLLAYSTYRGGANEFDDTPLHVLALFRGDLAQPTIRIDDYPTGVRPILDDLNPIHEIVRAFDERELPYYLGIVPALLTDEMRRFLRDLKHMIPAVHGYDHCYPRYAPILKEKNDPFNQNDTVGTFNEFEGVPYPVILHRLLDARKILEDEFGQEVTTYIPPCNKADRSTGRALAEAGYHRYLSEKKIPGSRLLHIPSDFYGRSDTFRPEKAPQVITLHTTWEWDVARVSGTTSLQRLLDDLSRRCNAKREQEESLIKRFERS